MNPRYYVHTLTLKIVEYSSIRCQMKLLLEFERGYVLMKFRTHKDGTLRFAMSDHRVPP